MTDLHVKFAGEPITVAIDRHSTIELPPRVFRARLTGMLFDTDKAFLLPSAMHGIRGLRLYYDQHPGLSVLVTGHCDTVGDPGYNEALSRERADAVAAYLVEDVDTWLAHYTGSAASRAWGTTEDQHMLSALPDGEPPYYAGPIDGIAGTGTQAAVSRFQVDHGLVEDGVAGPITRRAMIEAYMALDGTTLPAGTEMKTHGCGEHHLAVPTADQTDEPRNRRVEVFLFEGEIDPPPRPSCGGCTEYPEWLRRLVQTVDFGDVPGWLDVSVTDLKGFAVANAGVRVEGTVTLQAHTPANGVVRFDDLPAGPYRVVVVADGFEDLLFQTTVVPGEPGDAPVEAGPPAPVSEPNHTVRSNFLADDAAAGESFTGNGSQFGVNHAAARLRPTDTVVQIVRELPDGASPPGLTDAAREGVAHAGRPAWDRMTVVCQWATGADSSRRVATSVDTQGRAIFPLDKTAKTAGSAPVEKGVLESVGLSVQGFGTDLVRYTLRDPADPSRVLTSPPIEAGKITRVAISTRVRLSVWGASQRAAEQDLAGMRGTIDDLSLLTTVLNGPFQPGDDPKAFGVEWDESFRPHGNKNPAAELAFYEGIVAACRAQGVQALVGFQHALNRPGGRTADFHRWMQAVHAMGATEGDKALNLYAKRLSDFVFDQLPDADGISFDIEHIPPVAEMSIPDQASFFTRFYRAISVRLATKRKIVAIAVGEFDNQVASVAIEDLQARFDHATTMVFARVHPYSLAKGFPNILLRPMAFGSLSAQKGVAAQQKWHEDIVRYAMEVAGVPPEQFQLGVFLGSAPGEVSQRGPTMKQRCTEILRPNRVGLCEFALGGAHDWAGTKIVDGLLNEGDPPNTLGQPSHAPLSKALP